MRALVVFTLGTLLATGVVAQRHGGGGGGFRGGSAGGGFHGGIGGGGFRGGGGFTGSYGYRGGYGYGWGGRSYGGGYYPSWGFGFGAGYWPGYYGYSGYGYPYGYSSAYSYPVYQYAPAAAVVVPQTTSNSIYVERSRPVSHDYDEYGQPVRQATPTAAPAANASPIYLIAMKDGVIRAAASYWVSGQTLHYVTLEHQEKQAPLAEIDHALSQQLNRERRVEFPLTQ